MAHARTQHPNARLTPRHRRNMVACVIDHGWTIEQTAERFQVDPKTVRKWRDRFLAEGDAGLDDRSSRPHRCPNRTSRSLRRRVIRLRRKNRWGADHIAHELNMAASRSSRSCAQKASAGSIVAIGPPTLNPWSAINATSQANSCTSM